MNVTGRLELRVAVCAGFGGLPALALAAVALDPGSGWQGVAWVAAVVIWILGMALGYHVVQRPLRSLGAVVGGLQVADFTIAPKAVEAGALGALQGQIDGLASALRAQRLDAHEADALTRAVFAQMDVAVLAFDPQLCLSLCNPAAERVLGLDAARDMGRAASALAAAELLEGPYPRTLALLDHSSGVARHWELRVTSIRLGGKPQTLVVLTDVQHALRDEQWRSWQHLVRVLSHEINNSLAPIGSIAATLCDDLTRGDPSSEQRTDWVSGLNVIVRRVEALSRFLQGYAKLSRLPAPSRSELELLPLVQRAVTLETRVEVEIEGGPALSISADPDQLEQLLINLLKNAAEACLEARAAGAGRAALERCGVRVRWASSRGALTLEIEDDGPGLPETNNLFVPFFTTKAAGSGIGLVLCRQIAESHGGTLQLSNRKNAGGTLAQLRVPLDR